MGINSFTLLALKAVQEVLSKYAEETDIVVKDVVLPEDVTTDTTAFAQEALFWLYKAGC